MLGKTEGNTHFHIFESRASMTDWKWAMMGRGAPKQKLSKDRFGESVVEMVDNSTDLENLGF